MTVMTPKFLRRGCLLPVFRKVFPSLSGVVIEHLPYEIKIYIADAKDRMQAMIYYFREYEPGITKLVLDNIPEGGCFFDIGASIGYFSILAAKKAGPDGRVHAFEPFHKNYHLLKKNQAINSLDNIIINAMLVTDKIGDITFYPPNNPDEWGTGSIFDGNKKEAFTAPSVTLEGYINSRDIKAIDMIKIDAEGSELKIIEGLKPVLANVGYPKIICEVNKEWLAMAGSRPADLITAIKNLGYSVYKVGSGAPVPLNDCKNGLFNIFAVR